MNLRKHIQDVIRPENIDAIVSERFYKKGEYIYMPPAKPNEMFQLELGVIMIGSYSPVGEEVCYDILYQKEIFGNMRYLNGQFSEFAKAATDCKLITYELQFYKWMIVHEPIASEWFNKMAVSRWCRMENRLFKVCTLTPAQRLLELYNELKLEATDAQHKKVDLPSILSDTEIGQLCGLSRQTVSKLLKSYQRVHKIPLFKKKKLKQYLK
ncbi:Crp/Fnr family transcriptional regulator [Anditalea andensis]|nr:Crp/Fnr family transcriptional regulator [Anditalea andensis]